MSLLAADLMWRAPFRTQWIWGIGIERTRLRRWLAAIRNALTDFVVPFATIAAELRKMNQLKELELAERLNPKTGDPDPVILRTEEPGRHDTEITYGIGDEAIPRGKEARNRDLAAAWDRENVDDDE